MGKRWLYFLIIAGFMFQVACGGVTFLPIASEVESALKVKGVERCFITNMCDFSDIEYSPEKVIVSSKELAEAVKTELASYEELVEVTDRDIVEKGDFVNIAFTAYCENKIVNHSDSEEVKVGAGYFEEQIEKGLIGVTKGKKIILEVQVPEEDDNEMYAGKLERFEIVVNKIQYMHTVKLTDEFVKENYKKLRTVEEFYEFKRRKLQEELEMKELQQAKETFIQKAIKASHFQLDDDIVLNYALSVYNEYLEMSNGYGTTMEEFVSDFMGETMDGFYESCYSDAEYEIKRMLLVGAYARKNAIEVSKEEQLETLNKSKMSVDSLNEESNVQHNYQLLEDKVLNIVMRR